MPRMTANVETTCRYCKRTITCLGLIEDEELMLGQFTHVEDGEHFCEPTNLASEAFALPTDEAMGQPSMLANGDILLGSPIDAFAAKARASWDKLQSMLEA